MKRLLRCAILGLFVAGVGWGAATQPREQREPSLMVPAWLKLHVLVQLQNEGDPIGLHLVNRILQTDLYCGPDGAFRFSWSLHQDILTHLSASSRLDDDYPGAREAREMLVRDFKGVEFCPVN